MNPLRLARVLGPAALVCAALSAVAQDGAICSPESAAACAPAQPGAGGESSGVGGWRPAVLTFYWGVGCPHCEDAKPFLRAEAREHRGVRVVEVEIRQDASGRAQYRAEVARLGIAAPGIPLFVVGDEYVLGFSRGASDSAVTRLVHRAAGLLADERDSGDSVQVPLLGTVQARRVPLGLLTAVVGLADGLNPCAMWVLVVLLGVLANVRSRRRLLVFGGTFVVVSGVVYFAFMTAWSGLFAAIGGSRNVTIALGAALLLMGFINAKEVFLFRRGVSLTIPDRAKPALYRRMRGIVNATSLPAALAGVLALAFLANLVELGCTVGLPALYTRVLSLRELGTAERLAWLAAYNAFYVVPLAAIVVTWVIAAPRTKLGERGARILKGVSGVLLIVAGVVLLAAPHLLV